jgi:hypothetical protein
MGFNVCYTQGAPGFCTNNNFFQLYNSNTSVALGWVADGIFTGTAAGGSQVELTTAWSALAFYEHIWNPKWRTAVGGGYVNVDYNANATTAILQKTLGAAAACNVAAVGAATTGQRVQPRRQLLGSLYAYPVEPGGAARYRSRNSVLAAQHRLQGCRHRPGQRLASCGLRLRRPGCVVGDGALAA